MRSYRQARRYRQRSGGDFWLSFSDLMSSLVLIIVLVMFYIIYQYFNLAEINQAEIARRQYQLDETQLELKSEQGKLSDAEQQMIAQQILLDAKQAELEDAQAVLETQKTELETTQQQLTEKETEIADQQTKLDALGAQLSLQKNQLTVQQTQLTSAQGQLALQQTQLENQQQQLETLVGLKTRIITSLSTALRNNGISATVDPTNGSIALESDVMFETSQYRLSPVGKGFIDQFLPVYLDVLFSDDYRAYVAEIIIEGHTDSTGAYLENLKLSQQRALAVATYVLDDDYRGISAEQKRQLRTVVTANGRSFSDLIRDEKGIEDRNASRRVVFKFRLTDEQMIQQLREILEAE